jgi:hypothetical protein
MRDRPADRLVSPPARASARKRANADDETRREKTEQRDGQSARDPPPMTREQWLAYHVARAPKITPQQWAEMLLLLHTRSQDENESKDEEQPS